MVERQLPKLDVAGSSPVTRFGMKRAVPAGTARWCLKIRERGDQRRRRWARERFAAIDRAVQHGPADPTGSLRRLVKAYIDRIEIDPATKSGVLYLPPDAMSCLAREAAVNGAAHGDSRAAVKSKGEA